jgi:hypothetical protein
VVVQARASGRIYLAILFHRQMLHDYVTVDAYCWTLIEEFAR